VAHQHEIEILWANTMLFKLFVDCLSFGEVGFVSRVLMAQIFDLPPAGTVISVSPGINKRQPV